MHHCICDALRDLVPLVQFKKREKHQSGCVVFSTLHSSMGVFHVFKWRLIVQSI